jgi:hypothetical protein
MLRMLDLLTFCGLVVVVRHKSVAAFYRFEQLHLLVFPKLGA